MYIYRERARERDVYIYVCVYVHIFVLLSGAVKYTPPQTSVLYMTVSNLLELWGMQSTPLLASLPGPLWPRCGST